MSPAVSTATASAARGHGPELRRRVIADQRPARPAGRAAPPLPARARRRAARPPRAGTTQGRAASAWTNAAPGPPRAGSAPRRTPASGPRCRTRPARPSRAAAAARTPRPPARPAPRDGPTRRSGTGGSASGSPDGRASASVGAARAAIVSHASRSRPGRPPPCPGPSRPVDRHARGRSASEPAVAERAASRRPANRASGQRRPTGPAQPVIPAAPPSASRPRSMSYASRTHSTILSGSGEYSSSIETVARRCPGP